MNNFIKTDTLGLSVSVFKGKGILREMAKAEKTEKTNDALSANLANIATLLTKKFVYFVPMIQDDPQKKPHSLVADFNLLPQTLEYALMGQQYQKIFQ